MQSVPAALFHCQSTEFNILLVDKSSDCEQRNKIRDFALAMENMKDCLEISGTSSLTITARNCTYYRFSASFDSDATCRIPCRFTAPASGETVLINLLFLYTFESSEASRNNHRIIKIAIKVPLLNCLKLEYTTLRLLNATTYIGLIRAFNLTPVSLKFLCEYKNFEVNFLGIFYFRTDI